MHTKLHMWDPQWRLCMWSQGAGATPDTSVPPAAPLTGVKYKLLNLSVWHTCISVQICTSRCEYFYTAYAGPIISLFFLVNSSSCCWTVSESALLPDVAGMVWFGMKGLRKILRVSWTAKKTNEWVLNKAGVKRKLLDTVKARKLAYC